ncbi:MAG: conjugative transposon protein TraM [Sphingobacteriales bacterium]|nr:conjugative transposon protein TraM [Sphingobacteriales bacterium]MBI3717492.1 conjugative transposon protein TraM [Sphingobacteriales bacterium]
MKQSHSPKYLRQRKMKLVLPLLVIPFVTMAFWALGGGQGNAGTNLAQNKQGLNLQLPDANLQDDKNADKLAFYNEADADSLKREEHLRNDPYYKDSLSAMQNLIIPDTGKLLSTMPAYNGLNYSPYKQSTDANEQRIYQRINEINKQINQPETATISSNTSMQIPEGNEQFSNEVDKLQEMMMQMNDNPQSDPEMEQLNGTLEKILDIQHPDRVKDKLKEKSLKNKEQVFIISKQPVKNNVSLLDTSKSKKLTENKFYGIEKDSDTEEQNTVEAVVHQTQTLVNGAVVKMRLLNDIYLNGSLVPRGNFVFGTAQLNDERLEININSVINNNSLFPVKLEVFDMDGLPGIYIPGAISRDVAKQSADNSLQLMELTSMDPSFKAQAAATGINAAKSLLSKKVKQVKVLVKAGYKVLLRDKSIQQ